MSDCYFANHVFVTSVKNFDPYLAPSFLRSAIASDADILSSPAYKDVFAAFFQELEENDKELYSYFKNKLVRPVEELILISRRLLLEKRSVLALSYPLLFADQGVHFYKLMNAFFRYWLSLARFAYLDDKGKSALGSLKPRMLFLRKSVFHIYNAIKTNVLEKEITLETDYSAGFLAGFTTRKITIPYPDSYLNLHDIPFISAADLNLPYSTLTKRNKRIGVYQPMLTNPLERLALDHREWLCLPLWCGTSLVYFYFSYKYANTVLGTLNLFEKADIEACTRKPDIVIVFGGDRLATTGTYYVDNENDIMVGYVSDLDDADYFGYVKKLVLTLHNLRMIKQGALPIHGSMVKITLKGGKEVHLIIMGDSGAGKSESIEAFRHLAREYLESITIIFDDMGTLFYNKGKVTAAGTEIGAFVRLDDLELGYAFSHLNDALMYNVGENNSRLVYPCTPYNEVIRHYPVDIFLYANNYEDEKDNLHFFSDYHDLVAVAEEGRRKAKGTTGEVGLVSSYFANPFGPVQEKETTHQLVLQDFKALEKEGTKLGVIYTKLAISGHEQSGPEEAAKSLLEWIKAN
ncbi:MAG: hypothetical protein BWY98_00266 [Tenericutes bacterium ADurb.BinA155]|nr:MAG: hypothetical protein BWY98_00266 [Tenericutes bacterium ADurb.BinA155]